MKIETADINTIKPYENNPRKLKDSAIEKVAMSLKEYGFRQPIVVDKDRIIVVGHTRYRASKKLGFKEVPITIADNLTPEQINAYRIADNRTAEESEWDDELLAMEIKDLEAKDFKLDLLGFNEDQLNDILFEEKQGLTDEDETPEPPEEPITKLGNIWKLGKHKLICGDSTAEDTFKNLFNDNKADLIFTDPPYNVDYSGRGENNLGKIKNDNMSENDFIDFLYKNFNLMSDYLKSLGCIYVCHPDSQSKPKIAFELNFEKFFKKSSTIIWDKGNAGMGWQDYRSQHEPILYGWKEGQGKHSFYGDRKNTSIWNVKRDNVAGYKHPTQKPVALSQKAVLNNSKEDDIVFDSFLGSGSTLIACEKTNRKCYGIELDPKYCDVIVKRWENFTGKKAELENGQN
jgi:site-specific DNA-methyltransferase (adenine-specific)